MISEIKLTKKAVKEYLSNEFTGHDYLHAERVLRNAEYIQSKEGGDLYIIQVAALVHDLCRPFEKETGKLHTSEEALEIIRSFLIKNKVNKIKLNEILYIVKNHDIYDWTNKDTTKSLELKIVQDADNLDGLGAMAIARTFAYGGAIGRTIYNPQELLEFSKDYVEGMSNSQTSIGHFYEKLLKLKDNMNTKTGRRLAISRDKFIKRYLNQFFKECVCEFE